MRLATELRLTHNTDEAALERDILALTAISPGKLIEKGITVIS